MWFNRRLARDLSAAILACTTIAMAASGQDPEQGASTFVVMLRGTRIGFETVSLSRTGTGWLITSGGRLQAPFDMITTRFELTYGADWHPRQLAIEGVLQGQLVNMTTTFDEKVATTTLLKGDARSSGTVPVSANTVVLPANFFGAYEALAAQIGAMKLGSTFRTYLAPEFEVAATIDRITSRRITLPSGAVDVREFVLTFKAPAGAVAVEVWTDNRNRLVRVVLPGTGLLAIRDDLASVLAREEHVRNPGDEDLFIPAAGFSLGATITPPARAPATPARVPAVVLVSSPGPQDRDLTTSGVSVFGQIAGALASAGYFVVRYDGRGTGQSGGRTENATLEDYAQDVVGVVGWLRKRREVDGNRLAVVGYGEGAAVALLAAESEDQIRGVALLAAPGVGGRALTIEQQQDLLARLNIPAAERTLKIALQNRVLDATISGTGWEGIPLELRRQADSAPFRSWLLFDPAGVIAKLKQPIMIAHGALDTEIRPANADRLEAMSRSRRNVPATHTRKTIVPGIGHLFVPAPSGGTDSVVGLETRTISPAVPNAVTTWLTDVFRPR